jgi:hypothetical protein
MLFQKASRIKLRFDSPKGLLTVEDLWDLPLTSTIPVKPNIDEIAKGVIRQLKATEDESFVAKETKDNDLLQLQLEILKVVRDVKIAERDAATKARENAEKKQQILALIQQKKGEQLAGTSLEDLMKMAEAL